MTITALLILIALFTKHFIIDFPLQYPYQWKNKGTYGHPGGLLHAGLHAWATYVIIFLATDFVDGWPLAIMFGLLDGFLHYHIDWAKMNINKRMGWRPDTHPEFWTLMGLDQLLHALTYIFIVFMVI